MKLFKKRLKKTEIPVHKNAVSSPESMKQFADWVKQFTDIETQTIFEIGANYSQDAAGLQHFFNAKDDNIYTFEAHPDIVKESSKMYKFHVINNAVSNKNGQIEFNCVDANSENSGISSIGILPHFKDKYVNKVSIKAIRMDDFMNENNIKEIDFLKLDVEGFNYEVLEGFGDRLKDVKVIHVEAEHEALWDGQKLFPDIEQILRKNGFEMVFFQRYMVQSDSLWIQKRFLKSELRK